MTQVLASSANEGVNIFLNLFEKPFPAHSKTQKRLKKQWSHVFTPVIWNPCLNFGPSAPPAYIFFQGEIAKTKMKAQKASAC